MIQDKETTVSTYYDLLNLHPSASVQQIRRAYRELSKLYHPDTTTLPPGVAVSKFQALNEAYAMLSHPDRRVSYDRKIGYSRIPIIQPLPHLSEPDRPYQSSAYLDPNDRPLSGGELFALLILGLTLIGCLALGCVVGLLRGDIVL